MTQVLVTGGTGDLGRELVPRLLTKGYDVTVLSRRSNPPAPAGIRVVQGDLTTGAGLEDALAGAEVIVHCATGSRDTGIRGLGYKAPKKTDVDPTGRMLDAIKAKGSAPHIVYISIVGVDKIPLGYYRAKWETERAIEASGLPYTILRTTQWHTLADELSRRLSRSPIVTAPKGFSSQLLDAGEVADRMAVLVDQGPSQRVPDMGGPEVLDMGDVIRSWLKAKGKRRLVLSMPIPGRAMAGFRAGYHLAPEHADGRITWDQWLRENVHR
jgi:uncharacterized protein YbjT (DUF2867 family)